MSTNATNRYRQQWNAYFDGGIEMWSSFGYQYHSYKIVKYIVSQLDIPNSGKVVQIGTGLGVTVELLCTLFGEDRVIGYDLFNPLGHDNIRFLDTEISVPPVSDLAYLEIDVGSMSSDKQNRKKLLHWAIGNMVSGSYLLTNKNLEHELQMQNNYLDKYKVIELSSFDIPELWKNVHHSRLNTKVLLNFL